MDIWFWIWLFGAIGFAVIEASTMTFFILPFALGSFVALILNLLGVGLVPQWISFFVVATPSIFLLRPLARKISGDVTQTSGIDRMIDVKGIVTQRVDTDAGTGQIRVKGEIWLAAPMDGEQIHEVGEEIRVVRVEGTRAMIVSDQRNDDPQLKE